VNLNAWCFGRLNLHACMTEDKNRSLHWFLLLDRVKHSANLLTGFTFTSVWHHDWKARYLPYSQILTPIGLWFTWSGISAVHLQSFCRTASILALHFTVAETMGSWQLPAALTSGHGVQVYSVFRVTSLTAPWALLGGYKRFTKVLISCFFFFHFSKWRMR
jgi:hypothetical protein